jgi:hypothetical protein
VLVSALITKIRPLINDTVTTYRWSDADLYGKMNDALNELWRLRQSAFYTSSVTITKFTDLSATTDTIPVTDGYLQAIIYFVCYLTYLEDNDDMANIKLAEMYYQKFAQEMG